MFVTSVLIDPHDGFIRNYITLFNIYGTCLTFVTAWIGHLHLPSRCRFKSKQ